MKSPLHALYAIAAALLAGCAGYSGSGLAPGSSTSADVERVMGRPAEKLAAADGGSSWFYPHAPMGRDTYAVRIAADGKLRSIEQTLTDANLAKVVAGATTTREVREIFGPPNRAFRNNRQQLEIWEYLYYDPILIPHIFYVQSSADGIVREVVRIRDPSQDFPGSYH